MKNTKNINGLGDVVAEFTKVTGIETLVKKIVGDDCGCEARRKKLNEKFPLKK